MIIGWKITKAEKNSFYIRPIIKKDGVSEPISDEKADKSDLTDEEYENFKYWGFFDGDESLDFWIHAMRQVDMLEADFTNTDLSEVRKLAEKLKLPW